MTDFSSAKPEDFYFFAAHSHDYEGDIVVINPIRYWNAHGCVYDQHLGIEHILPDYMGECNEAMFETTASLEVTIKHLRARGFQESEEFSKFCREHDPFCFVPDGTE